MGLFDRIFGKKVSPAPETKEEIRYEWHDVGPDNPFGIRFLDCRPLTQTVIATTESKDIAERYLRLRDSDGRDLIDAPIAEAVQFSAMLEFPHNGAALEGIVFKAPTMDVKWDLYIYDSVFLLARSWTGELCFRAFAEVGESSIRIHTIECRHGDEEVAASHVFFILGTHALKRILPHRIPPDFPGTGDESIAAMSFGLFGRYACYATYDDVTAIPIPRPEE